MSKGKKIYEVTADICLSGSQIRMMLDMCGGEDEYQIRLMHTADGVGWHSGSGLYAVDVECPGEGCIHLGRQGEVNGDE